jgi:hypothetical protein
LQGGVQGADITYTLPTAYPGGNGYSLTSTAAGVLSWTNLNAPFDIATALASSTSGSVLYVSSSHQLAQDNANFFWDATNHRLGLGTTTPGTMLHLADQRQAKITANDAGSIGLLAYARDNIPITFDADLDSSWIARDTSVAAVYKVSGQLIIYGSGGNTPGGAASGIGVAIGIMNIDLLNNVVKIGTDTASSNTKLTIDSAVAATGYYPLRAYNSTIIDDRDVYFGVGKAQDTYKSVALVDHIGTTGASYANSYLLMQNYGDTYGYGVSVLAGGYVGIDVDLVSTVPKAPLWVDVGSNLNLGVSLSSSSVLLSANQDDNAGLKPFRIAGSEIIFNPTGGGGGNVGIGNTSPGTALDVTGSITSSTIASSCDVFSDGSGTLICDPSSRRYKDNIQNLSFDKEKFLSLQTITFEYKKNLVNVDGEQVGFIAEDVLPIFPDLVRYKDGQIEGIKYEKIPIYLYQIVQDQQKDIDALKAALGGTVAQTTQTSVAGVDNSNLTSLVQNIISSMGISFQNGLTTIQNLAVDKPSAKIAAIDRLEMKDRATGEIWCTFSKDGQMQKVQGTCDTVSLQNTSESTDNSSQTQEVAPQDSQVADPVVPDPSLQDSQSSDSITSPSGTSSPDTSSTDTPAESVTQ